MRVLIPVPDGQLTRAAEFTATQAWAGLDVAAFDGLLLPGGHAPGMRQYLGSPVLRERVARSYVEDEVRAVLDDPARQFERGPVTLTARGTAADDGPAFVVQDGNYLSARWPGDAYLFGRRFCDLLEDG